MIAAVGAYAAFQSVAEPIRKGATAGTATIGVSGPSVQAVGYEGTKVPIWVAMYLLGRCECLGLPGSGPLSPFHVEGAWVDGIGDITFDFDSGVELSVTPDGRTEQDFVAAVIDSNKQSNVFDFSLRPLRRTIASAADLDQNGPSSLSWVEGPYGILMLGQNGQRLNDLIPLAESMPFFPESDRIQPVFNGGRRMAFETARVALRRCRCPQVADSAPSSPDYGRSWDLDGVLAIDFRRGLTAYFTPYRGAEADFLSASKGALIEDLWPGHIISMRGTEAIAYEQLDNGAPLLEWIEGDVLVSMLGSPQNTLGQLIKQAKSLRYCAGCP